MVAQLKRKALQGRTTEITMTKPSESLNGIEKDVASDGYFSHQKPKFLGIILLYRYMGENHIFVEGQVDHSQLSLLISFLTSLPFSLSLLT